MNKVMTATLVLAVSVLAGCVADPYYGDRGFYGASGAYYSERSNAYGRTYDNSGYPVYNNGGYSERRPDSYETRRYDYYR